MPFDKIYLDRYGEPVQKLREQSATQKFRLGERYAPPWDPLGRVYRYALAGAAITPGKLLGGQALSGAATTLQTACSVSVASQVGDKRIYLTIVTTAQAASLFTDGIAVVNDVSATPDEFYTFAIKDNTALVTTGTTGYIELYEEVPVALTTSDKVDLTVNPWYNAIEMPVTTHVACPVGVAGINVTSGYYFWCQTWGPCGIMSNSGPLTIGADVLSDVSLAGSILSDTAAVVATRVGFCLNVSTDVYGATVFLQIAP